MRRSVGQSSAVRRSAAWQQQQPVRCWFRYEESRNSDNRANYASQAGASSEWLLDTGANMHVTSDLSKLNATNSYHGSNGITVGNGESLNISHTGTRTIKTPIAIFHLGNLTHVPSIKTNLLSVHQFTKDNNCSLLFTSNDYQILDNTTKRVIFQGPYDTVVWVTHLLK